VTSTAGAGVHVEMDGVMKNLDEMQDLIEGKNRDIMRYGRAIMKQETMRAFTSKRDPTTGRAWAARQESYPWPLLMNTRTLYGLLNWSYGIKTRDRKMKFFGKIEEGFAKGNYTRGGGGISLGARKPYILVAGAIYFGRKRARSTALWKPKAHGYIRSRGKMVFHGGGTKLHGQGPATGKVPGRQFFGFGRSSRKRIKRYAEKRLAKVFD